MISPAAPGLSPETSEMNLRRARKSRQRLGRKGELAAWRVYRRLGCELLAHNWRTRAGELDLVIRDGATICFVEVKSRRFRPEYTPADNLSARQCRRNRHAAELYFRMIGCPGFDRRYELVEVIYGRFGIREIRRHPDYLPPQYAEET